MRDADGNLYESCCGTSRNGRSHYYRVKSTGASMRKEDAERVRRAVARVLDRTPNSTRRSWTSWNPRPNLNPKNRWSARPWRPSEAPPQIDRKMDNLIDLRRRRRQEDHAWGDLRALTPSARCACAPNPGRGVARAARRDGHRAIPALPLRKYKVPIPSCAVSWTRWSCRRGAACWSSSTSAPPSDLREQQNGEPRKAWFAN